MDPKISMQRPKWQRKYSFKCWKKIWTNNTNFQTYYCNQDNKVLAERDTDQSIELNKETDTYPGDPFPTELSKQINKVKKMFSTNSASAQTTGYPLKMEEDGYLPDIIYKKTFWD